MTGSLQVKRGIYYMTVSFKDEKGACRQKSKSTGIPEKQRKQTEGPANVGRVLDRNAETIGNGASTERQIVS